MPIENSDAAEVKTILLWGYHIIRMVSLLSLGDCSSSKRKNDLYKVLTSDVDGLDFLGSFR